MINFDYRRRIIESPEDLRDSLDPEERRALEPEPFSKWLRRHNLLPPDFATPDYDEEQIIKEYDDVMEDKVSKIIDHQDDTSNFEICVINKRNQGILIDAVVNNGEISLGKVIQMEKDALSISSMGVVDRARLKLYGPKWDYLSERLQKNLMKYLFSAGVSPNIGICVEYLSWNKEQRLYMGWMRDIYSILYG